MYNMEIIEETLNKGTSMKIARRTLGIGMKPLHTLKNEYGQITNNKDRLVKVEEEF